MRLANPVRTRAVSAAGARARRRRAVVGLALGVLALHAMVLLALVPAPRVGPVVRPQRPPVELRVLPATRVTVAPPPVAVGGMPPARVSQAPAAVAALSARPAPAASRPAAPTSPPPAPASPSPARTPPPMDGAGAAAGTPVPVYPTRLPPSARLDYEMQRGTAAGRARLTWARSDGDYALQLDAEIGSRPAIGATSQGGVDADGLAPVRHVERRRARDLRAVNFQREAGRITFSGPQGQVPLVPGAQDRLSWMIQLPAILEADAALGRPGARITLFVVGVRGDAEAWHFEVDQRAPVELPAGSVDDVLHLVREPTRPYDLRVEVWLDPARGHLPIRARFTPVPAGESTELRLTRLEPGF